MAIVFAVVIVKVYALVAAFSRRSLKKSLILVQKTNHWIMWISIIVVTIFLINDTVSLTIYLTITDTDEKEKFASHLIVYSLLIIIISGAVQVGLLIMLFPMYKKYKRALKLQKLGDYFKNNAFPRNSVRLFAIFYIFRSFTQIAHGVWAVFQYLEFHAGTTTSDTIMARYSDNEIFLLVDEVVNLCTVVLMFVFYGLFARNMRRVRENIAEMDLAKSKRSQSH